MIEHFRVLPTDCKYKELSWDQIELLFLNYVSQPSDEQYRQSYLKELEVDDITEGLPEDIMEDMGYNKEEIKEVAKILQGR